MCESVCLSNTAHRSVVRVCTRVLTENTPSIIYLKQGRGRQFNARHTTNNTAAGIRSSQYNIIPRIEFCMRNFRLKKIHAYMQIVHNVSAIYFECIKLRVLIKRVPCRYHMSTYNITITSACIFITHV